MKPVSGQLNATQKENKAQVRIPKEYLEFLPMFRKKAYKKLPKHRDWDHEILIEEEKKPTYSLIYALSKTELKALQEYLDKNLRKEFIQTSTLPARYPIFV